MVRHLSIALTFLPVWLTPDATGEERTEESFIPNYAVASSYFTWYDDADFSRGGGSVAHQKAGIEVNVPILMREKFRLTAGAKYRWDRLDFTGAAFPLGSQDFDLHRVDLPFNLWVDFNRKWKLWLRAQPGWYSDFENVGSDDFILTSLALLSYRWSDSVKVAFGAYYSKDLGEERLLPAFGLIIEPNRQWSLGLTFPRAELVYAPTEDWLITARALLDGAGWNIRDPAGGREDVDLNYKAIRTGIGVDRRISGRWWGYIDAGYQFGQEIEIKGGANPFSEELDPSAYVRGGIKLRF